MDTVQRITVPEAAKVMGVTPQFLRLGLQRKQFPFGVAVQFKQWSYYINPEQFRAYVAGQMGGESA